VSSRPSTTEASRRQAAAGGMFVSHESVRYLLLTSFKQDGAAVSTAVRVALDGDRAYFRTVATSGPSKRVGRRDWVQVAPCSPLGFVRYGPPAGATARLLAGAEASRAAGLLAREYPAWRSSLSSLARRVTGWQAVVYYELRADKGPAGA
jgi:PPOX class probable F420-dependent enzyme